jgi:hypothetical protein
LAKGICPSLAAGITFLNGIIPYLRQQARAPASQQACDAAQR